MANVDHLVLAARQHQLGGRLVQAEQVLRRALQADPGRYDANHLMALVLMNAGAPDRAEYFIRRAVASRPTDPELHNSLGLVLAAKGASADAARAFEESSRLGPAYGPPLLGLGNLRTEALDFDAAEECYRRAAALTPGDAAVACNAAMLLLKTGRADEAAAALRAVLKDHPGHLEALDRLAHVLNYVEGADARDVFEVHAAYGRLLESLVPAMPPPAQTREPERRLRVGYLSPDFRAHSVASFIEPLLEQHDRAAFEVLCYSTGKGSDATTARLRSHAAAWRDVGAVDDGAAAERIRADRVDVLVELSGHTAGGRLGIMARRPAPVQATFIGYPHTTGLTRVDVRLVDAHTDPAGAPTDARATERLIRVPGCFLCYRPPPMEDDPGVSPAPSAGGAPVTFGSFNHLPKVGPGLVALWSRVLLGVPRSRLVLKSINLVGGATRERLLGRFAAAGVDPRRVELLAGLPSRREHLGAYARVDVALDTFPYHGTTTTCEALWMGVPVVTLAGDVHASRVGVGLLKAADLAELIAGTPDGYVALAASWAGDPARLASLRGSLRERVRGSGLCDGPGYARRIETALRGAWRAWCADARRGVHQR
ncbi:MAG: tetratricopeptide repeat protein [Phycisphaerales bacterium]